MKLEHGVRTKQVLRAEVNQHARLMRSSNG